MCMEDVLIQRKTKAIPYDFVLPNTGAVANLFPVLDYNPHRMALLIGSSIDGTLHIHFGNPGAESVSYCDLLIGATPIVLSLMLHGDLVTLPVQIRCGTASARIHLVETVLLIGS